ncbi:MAG: hypothetical protein A3E87_07435 [Gammaproteobacteria bacterium RIFCSPHIGHO2_12_FULL_35_23]|nr:MAG: hypothetical protein A3E87_07435 [Gammaproteobacteria bacterium RIFCSPHIGHO2_12_FULL_35_23]
MKIFTDILNSLQIDYSDSYSVQIEGKDPILPTPFLLGEASAAAQAAMGYAVSVLWFLKTQRYQTVRIKVKEAAIALRSHQYLRIVNNITPELWDPISGFYQTKNNRWVQLHCNFPNHRQGVIATLRCQNSKPAVIKTVKNWEGEKLEAILLEQGLCAALVRSADEWENHPQAKATRDLPLLEVVKINESSPEPLPTGNLPLSGIKVLDLTRVIAGPVGGKILAQFGATVMSVTSPHLPFILPLIIDNGFGKLSTQLDLNLPAEKEQLYKLIAKADIFLQAYRPQGLDHLGFSPHTLASKRPGIIYISLSAYAHQGPWSSYHGFDSLVQSATGLVFEQSKNKLFPQHLPGQALDYIAGYLLAFGALEALRRRATEGGSYWVRVSLLQVATWLKNLKRVENYNDLNIPTRNQLLNLLTQTVTSFGLIEHMLPVLHLSETPPTWSRSAVPLDTHPPRWP